MNKNDKQALIEDLSSSLGQADVVLLAHQYGLSVSEFTDLRKKMIEIGAKLKVVKNTLAKIAVSKLSCASVSEYFNGPTFIVWGSEIVDVAKVLSEFAKKNKKVEILCGAIGADFLNHAAVDKLAQLPNLDILRGGLVGIIKAPATRLVRLHSGVGARVVRLISAYAEKID